jgi:hypothetical protein
MVEAPLASTTRRTRLMTRSRRLLATLAAFAFLLGISGPAVGQPSFITFESGHVRPLALSPDGTRLFAVNTPDNRLEVFSVSGGGLTLTDSIPVGMEPVAVAARTNTEIWVVNHLSDSVSIICRRCRCIAGGRSHSRRLIHSRRPTPFWATCSAR